MVYDTLKEALMARGIETDEHGELSTRGKLCSGAVAGMCGQTVAYPFDTVRRNLQVQSMKVRKGEPLPYKGMIDCFRTIVRRDGVTALYSGLWPNYLKCVPSVSISFVTFEHSKRLLDGHHASR